MPLVGLTGGMGAGKSTALEILQTLGAAVLSTDAVVHELYATDVDLRNQLIARWGESVAPGEITDRALVAGRVFSDEAERRWLESLLWPKVAARVAAFVDEVRTLRPPPKAAVVEVPLLFEAGMEGFYDATIAVIADEPLRRERAAGRGHALADERASQQLSQAEKARRASFTVHNNGTVSDLQAQLAAVLAEISSA
ncbi:MAG TPA: dephospho-CoA kinase [Solirubrobacteraceae bacterium]